MTDQHCIYGDQVRLAIPGAELIGVVTGIIYRRDHHEYEVLWNDGQTLYHGPKELEAHKEYETTT